MEDFKHYSGPNQISVYTILIVRISMLILFLYLLKKGYLLSACFLFILIFTIESSAILSKAGLRKLLTDMDISPKRLFPGGEGKLFLEIQNNKRLPVLLSWSLGQTRESEEVAPEDLFDLEVHGKTYLGAYDNCSETYQFIAQKRGYYQIPGLQIRCRDIFGFFAREEFRAKKMDIYVYPKLIPIKNTRLKPSDFSGLTRIDRPFIFDPALVVGLRDYTPDMSARYINWKASAHQDKLLTKITEASASLKICIALDPEPFLNPEPREKEFENALSLVATVAVWADSQKIPFGILLNSAKKGQSGSAIVPVDRSVLQCRIVLETLARVELKTCGTLEEIFKAQTEQLPWGTTMLVIGNKHPVFMPPSVKAVLFYEEAADEK